MIYNKENQQHLQEIKDGTSKLFPVIPNEIGNVVFCATDSLALSKSKKELIFSKIIKLIVTILIVAAVVGFLSLSGTLFLPIAAGVIGVAIIVFMAVRKARFEGSNEILGTEGFVKQWFENSRDNITVSNIYKFSDMYDIIVEAKDTYWNGVFYDKSDRKYHYWNLVDRKSKRPTLDREVTYFKDGALDDFEATTINIEELWTSYRLRMIRPAFDNNEMVYFNYFYGQGTYEIFDKYIGISKSLLIIDGKQCNKENIKDIKIHNGDISIKTDQGNIHIEVRAIGSFRAFYTLLLEFVKNNLPIKFYAAIGGDAGAAMKDALREKGFDC